MELVASDEHSAAGSEKIFPKKDGVEVRQLQNKGDQEGIIPHYGV